MFVVGMASVVLGYSLVYYGVSLWEKYRANVNNAGIPLSAILGLSNPIKSTPNANANNTQFPVAKLPFDESGSSGTTTGANPTTPTTPTTPSTGGSTGGYSVPA